MCTHKAAAPDGIPPAAGALERLDRTIDEGLIGSVFQPVVDLRHGQITGFEALSRPDASSGFANAGELFDAAERASRLWPLEDAARAATSAAAQDWPAGTLLFLNCSPQVFTDPRFCDSMLDMAHRTCGLCPSRVVLEITERSDQQFVDGMEEQVRLLRSHGFQIALDDVGAGASGLNRMLALRPHWLKLDRALVAGIDTDRVRQNLVRFLVHFSRISGVKVVAEGIERREELATLMDLGVLYGQGFYLGRPGRRDQRLDEAVAGWIRDRWTTEAVEAIMEPIPTRVERFAQRVLTASAETPIKDVAAPLLRDPRQSGVAIVDGQRYVGWCPRGRALQAVRSGLSLNPVCTLVRPGATAVGPEAPISEALAIVGARDDEQLDEPLVVATGAVVHGVLSVRELLAAAADVTQNINARTTPLTGLPGRVLADEHIVSMIARANGEPNAAAPGSPVLADAAILDIRHFTDYNGAFGYELGDRLLQDLVTLLRSTLVRGAAKTFIAHLGDDRFLLTAPRGVLGERAGDLIDGFERLTRAACELFGHDGMQPANPDALGSIGLARPGSELEVGLRIVLLPSVFGRIEEPKDLYRLADRVRHQTASSVACIARPCGTRSIIITERPFDASFERLSA